MSGLKVLIVDDSRYVARLIQIKLVKLGWTVLIESNSARCVEVMDSFQPDAVLLDLVMPVMDGLTVLRQIRLASGPVSDTPVIMHSVKSSRPDVMEALKGGADDFIVKPASIETILDKISGALAKRGFTVLVDAQDPRVSKTLFSKEMGPEERMEALLSSARKIKTLPEVIQKALEITDDDESGAPELAKVIQSDTGITALLLRRCNTVELGKSDPIADTTEAIVRVGFAETRNLILGLGVTRSFSPDRKSLGFSRVSFWEHSLAVALLAKQLAERVPQVDENLAFTAGLLHDTGKIVLDEYATDDFDKAQEIASLKQIPLHRAETATMGLNHNEVGRALLEQWKLPAAVQSAARYHNDLASLETSVHRDHWTLVRIVALANDLAKACRIGHGGDEILGDCPTELITLCGLEDAVDGPMLDRVLEELAEYREFMRIQDTAHERAESGSHAGERVYFVRDLTAGLNLLETYLQSADFDVEACTFDHAKTTMLFGDRGTIVWDVEAGVEVAAVHKDLSHIPSSVPVVILGHPKFVADWSGFQNATVLTKPVSAGILVQALVEKRETADTPTPEAENA